MPTTVGTGSEVTMYAVITDRAQCKKVVIGSPLLVPGYAFLDPELVLTLPDNLIAATGIDALTHAIESVISTFANPFSDALALEAIRLIVTNLPAAVKSSGINSMANLLYASAIAGMAFSYARTGLVHGMAHPLSSYCDVPHGLANAILIPHVMEFNLPAAVRQFALVAAAMGEAVEGLPPRQAAASAVYAVSGLCDDIGIPASLSELGIPRDDIPMLVQGALTVTRPVENNPRTLGPEEAQGIYENAFD